MVKLLESALNRASNNELKIRCAQERKNRLREAALAPDEDATVEENQSMRKGSKAMNDTKHMSKGSFGRDSHN
jgi:hypothetical protein